MIDSFGILLAKSTIPLLILSLTNRTDWTVANCSLRTMKHILPVALDVCNLPLTNTSCPFKLASKSFTAVNVRLYLSSGFDCDLLSSRSPKRWADGSLGSFLYSTSAVFYYLAANLSCFFFSLSCLVFCFFCSFTSTGVPSVVAVCSWV